MPAAIVAAAIVGGAAVGSAAIQSHAAGSAANTTSNAANHAADVQSTSTREALDFTKQQAAHDAAVAEANRRANYDQWAAQQRRLGSVGDLLGKGPREIPGYVPLPPASFQTGPGGPAAPGGPAGGSVGDILAGRRPTPAALPAGQAVRRPGVVVAAPPLAPPAGPFDRSQAGLAPNMSVEELLNRRAA